MPIYRYTATQIQPISAATFKDLQISERADLQRLLRDSIEIIAPDTLVIAEEFSSWNDSRRRIDLLAIDKDANLVVIELKRTEDGGHMELQAIRYAAMVSTITFQQAVDAFRKYLTDREDNRDPRQTILEFLEWDEPQDDDFGSDVRIVLASAEFSRELTTAVLWLNERDIDIRCVRLRPYGSKEETLLDVQQVIPLPEAEDYQVKVREKKQVEREARKDKKREPWNGRDFYASFGDGPNRSWEDAVEYGFVSASGGSFYTKTLYHLEVGSRVFVNIPKTGFVGVAVVTDEAKPITDFKIQQGGVDVPIMDAVGIRSPGYATNAEDPELCQHYVQVRWLKHVPKEQAFWVKGLFASQHSACKLRDSFTINTLTKHFGIEDDE